MLLQVYIMNDVLGVEGFKLTVSLEIESFKLVIECDFLFKKKSICRGKKNMFQTAVRKKLKNADSVSILLKELI